MIFKFEYLKHFLEYDIWIKIKINWTHSMLCMWFFEYDIWIWVSLYICQKSTYDMKMEWTSLHPAVSQHISNLFFLAIKRIEQHFFATKLIKQHKQKFEKLLNNMTANKLYLNLNLMFNIFIINFKIKTDIKTTVKRF